MVSLTSLRDDFFITIQSDLYRHAYGICLEIVIAVVGAAARGTAHSTAGQVGQTANEHEEWLKEG